MAIGRNVVGLTGYWTKRQLDQMIIGRSGNGRNDIRRNDVGRNGHWTKWQFTPEYSSQNHLGLN